MYMERVQESHSYSEIKLSGLEEEFCYKSK